MTYLIAEKETDSVEEEHSKYKKHSLGPLLFTVQVKMEIVPHGMRHGLSFALPFEYQATLGLT